MKKDKLERKLRKMAVKLATLAHENGIEHIDMFTIDHPDRGESFCSFSADNYGDMVADGHKFIEWGDADA